MIRSGTTYVRNITIKDYNINIITALTENSEEDHSQSEIHEHAKNLICRYSSQIQQLINQSVSCRDVFLAFS